MKFIKTKSGVSIIATVLTLLLIALFGAVVVSLVITGSSIGLQEEQGVQAFYIAEGGIEKALRYLQDGGRCQDITGDPALTNISLGAGTFTVTATRYRTIPNARLLNNILATDTSIQADQDLTAAGYAPSGRIFIQTPPAATEAISYSSITFDTFNNCIRGVDGTTALPHNANDRIVQNQCDITSTGTISTNPFTSVVRTIKVSVQL